jgi:shikimate kinase
MKIQMQRSACTPPAATAHVACSSSGRACRPPCAPQLPARRPAAWRPSQLATRGAPALRAAAFDPPPFPSGPEYEANNKSYAELTASIEVRSTPLHPRPASRACSLTRLLPRQLPPPTHPPTRRPGSPAQAAAAEAVDSLAGASLYLVGMMGSGKSTVGKLLAAALGYCHFDTDALIEAAAGRPVRAVFAEDGEEEFREAETRVLAELAPFKDCVVSTGGGAPTRGVNWGHMQAGVVVWLNGPPALLAHRVVADGAASRPLLAGVEGEGHGEGGDEYAQAVARLSALLEGRRQQYEFADITVSLEASGGGGDAVGAAPAEVALRVLLAVTERVRRDAAARVAAQSFQVVNESLPPSMRVVKSINDTGDAGPDPFRP